MFKKNQLSIILTTSITITGMMHGDSTRSPFSQYTMYQEHERHESPEEKEARINREFQERTRPEHYREKQIISFALVAGAFYSLYKYFWGNKKETEQTTTQSEQSSNNNTESSDAPSHNESTGDSASA